MKKSCHDALTAIWLFDTVGLSGFHRLPPESMKSHRFVQPEASKGNGKENHDCFVSAGALSPRLQFPNYLPEFPRTNAGCSTRAGVHPRASRKGLVRLTPICLSDGAQRPREGSILLGVALTSF